MTRQFISSVLLAIITVGCSSSTTTNVEPLPETGGSTSQTISVAGQPNGTGGSSAQAQVTGGSANAGTGGNAATGGATTCTIGKMGCACLSTGACDQTQTGVGCYQGVCVHCAGYVLPSGSELSSPVNGICGVP
jgi:hypothetical protein